MPARFDMIVYEELVLDLGANKVPHPVGGLRNYVAVLDTSDATDSQEVTFDGSNWTRLRKGLFIPLGPDGTTFMAFRDPSGAGGINVKIGTGFGAMEDRRLIVDASQGIVPVAISGAPAAGGAQPVSISGVVPSGGSIPITDGPLVLEDVPFFSGSANGAGLVSTVIVAAGANVNGLIVKAGGIFMTTGSPGECHLFGAGANTIHVAGYATQFNAAPQMQVLQRDVKVPAGIALELATQGTFAYAFNVKTL